MKSSKCSTYQTHKALKSTLQLYCEGSGQRINFQKSSIFFGSRCDEAVKSNAMIRLGVQNEALQETYLGMPTFVGRSPINTFKFLPDRVWKRINGGTGRPLSRAGKEVMLKSVAQAIPTYIMNCFELPVAICDNLRSSISNDWWGIENGKKKMHWRSWDWLTTPKHHGGMGFRDMRIFNQAMLGKQCWRLLTEPNSLCARVLKGRYFPSGDFWTATCPRSASYTWRSLLFGKEILKKGVRWCVGDGSMIRITSDNWIPDVPANLLRPLVPIPDGQTVDSLIEPNKQSWDVELLKTIFREADVAKILQVPISRQGCEDYISWPHTKFGHYSVRSA